MGSARIPGTFKQWLASLVGVAAVIAALLTWLQSDLGRKADDASLTTTLRNIDVFVELAAGGSRDQFERDATRRSLVLDKEVISRFGAVDPSSPAYRPVALLANVEAQAAKRLIGVTAALKQVPDEAPGVDQPMLQSLAASDPDKVDPLIAEAQAASERADSYGKRSSHATLGLAITAIAVALLGLGGLTGASRQGRVLLTAGALALLTAAALAVTSLLG